MGLKAPGLCLNIITHGVNYYKSLEITVHAAPQFHMTIIKITKLFHDFVYV